MSMTKEEKENRIKTSKYFLYRLNEIENELNNKIKELDYLEKEGRPAGYKKDVSINEITIQQSKKNFTAEILFKDYEEKINKVKLEIEKLENQYKSNRILLNKIENFQEEYFLKSLFIYKLPKSDIKKIFKIKSNNDFDSVLNNALISFSYILENEFKKKIPKNNLNIGKEIKTE